MDRRSGRVARSAAAAVVCVGLGGCWLSPGQGPDRRAHNPFESVLTADTVAGLAQDWEVDTGDARAGAPVVSPGGGLHVSAGNRLVTLAAATGAERWSHAGLGAEFGTTSDPFVRGDEVIVGSGLGNLGGSWGVTALDVADGTPRDVPGAGGLVDGLRATTAAVRWVGFGSGTPILHGIGVTDVETGAGWSGTLTITSFGGGGGPVTAPYTVGTTGVWQAGAGTLQTTPSGSPAGGYGVRRFSFERPADCAPPGGTYPFLPCPSVATPVDGAPTAPVLTDSSVVVATGAGTVYALDQADGSVLWTRAVGGPVTAPPAVAGDDLFVVTTGGDLAVLDLASGEPRWGASGLGSVSAQPAVAGGVAYVAGADGVVRAFDAGGCGSPSCTALWQDDTGDAAVTGAPAVSGGRLYVGTGDGRVVAYGLPDA